MFPWFLQTFHPAHWLTLAVVWTLVWRRSGESTKSLGVTFAVGMVAMLPLQAMMLQFLTVDAAGIGADLLGRYPRSSVNFGGFKITFLMLRPVIAFLQMATDWSDEVLLQFMKAAHAWLGVALFSLAFRLIPHKPGQWRQQQMIACLGFLVPSVFFANKILNYDSVSNAFALLSAIASGRYWLSRDRSWAVAAFLSAAVGFAEKVTALPFLIVALVALGWSTEDRRWRELGRVYAFALFWLIAPVVAVIVQLWTLSFEGTPGRAVADGFGGLLVWTMPLRNFSFMKTVLTPLWAQSFFSLGVLAVLLWLPGWPPVRSRLEAFLDSPAARALETRGARLLRWSVAAIVVLGLVAPQLVSPKWMAPHNVAPGIVTTTELNGMSVNFDTTDPLIHAASFFLSCSWQVLEWWPTLVIGLVLFLFIGGGEGKKHRLAYWLILCGAGYLVFFVLTRNPPGHRYVAPGGIVLVVGLLMVFQGFLSKFRIPVQHATMVGCIALTLLELGRYWPCSGAFRPVVMSYPVSEEVPFGDAKAPWLGWGEEVSLVAHVMRERRAAGETVPALFIMYGRLLGFPDLDCKTIVLRDGAIPGARPGDWVLLNRTMKLLHPRQKAKALFTLRYSGWPVAWVYKVGDVFPEAVK